MRMSVRSRRLCLTSSWPAADGVRCVNPSSAIVAPSEMNSATASRSDIVGIQQHPMAMLVPVRAGELITSERSGEHGTDALDLVTIDEVTHARVQAQRHLAAEAPEHGRTLEHSRGGNVSVHITAAQKRGRAVERAG